MLQSVMIQVAYTSAIVSRVSFARCMLPLLFHLLCQLRAVSHFDLGALSGESINGCLARAASQKIINKFKKFQNNFNRKIVIIRSVLFARLFFFVTCSVILFFVILFFVTSFLGTLFRFVFEEKDMLLRFFRVLFSMIC